MWWWFMIPIMLVYTDNSKVSNNFKVFIVKNQQNLIPENLIAVRFTS